MRAYRTGFFLPPDLNLLRVPRILPSFAWFCRLRLFSKLQGGGVDAVAQSGWRRSVFEDVAEMSVATVADDFGSDCEEASVGLFADVIFLDWLPVTRPASAGFVFGLGAEERQVAGSAVIGSLFLVVPMEAGEGAFSSFLSKDSVLLFGQELFPFRFRFDDFWDGAVFSGQVRFGFFVFGFVGGCRWFRVHKINGDYGRKRC